MPSVPGALNVSVLPGTFLPPAVYLGLCAEQGTPHTWVAGFNYRWHLEQTDTLGITRFTAEDHRKCLFCSLMACTQQGSGREMLGGQSPEWGGEEGPRTMETRSPVQTDLRVRD